MSSNSYAILTLMTFQFKERTNIPDFTSFEMFEIVATRKCISEIKKSANEHGIKLLPEVCICFIFFFLLHNNE